MNDWLGVEWKAIFAPTTSLLEIVIRGTLTYLLLFVILRIVLRRHSGTVGIADLLVIVLIADAAQNGMTNNTRSITESLLLVATILFWSHTMDWLGYRFPHLQRFVHPPPLLLVRDGRLLHSNMRRELITESELMSQLRQQGIDDVGRVKEAHMEGDGRISVVARDPQPETQGNNERRGV